MSTKKKSLTPEERKARREEQRERINEAVEALRTDSGFVRWIKTRRAINRFSFYNRLLIAVQKPDAVDVRTYNAWKKAGRQVKKGEKAIVIVRPVFIMVDVDDPDTGETKQERRLIGFSPLNEFDVSQTEGDPLPESPDPGRPDGDSHAWVIPHLVHFAEKRGYKVSFGDDLGSAAGLADLINKRIRIADAPVNSQVSTLIHEIAHTYETDYTKYSREDAEVIVQTVSWMVAEGLNLDTSAWTTYYLANWSRPDETSALRDFAKVIDSIANEIEDAIAHKAQPDSE